LHFRERNDHRAERVARATHRVKQELHA
jgi:hypothetical protein